MAADETPTQETETQSAPPPSDDDLAAQWEAEIGAAEGDENMPSEATQKVLSQNEIDGLMGFDNDDFSKQKSPLEAIVQSNMIYYERLPMLEVVFDRMVRVLSTSLRNFTSDNVEVTLESIQAIRFGDYLNSVTLPAMISVFKAQEWDEHGLMCIDSSLIYSVVDVLLGGRRGTAVMRIEGRPFTTIERNLIAQLVQVILSDLSVSFEPICPVRFSFDRLETNPNFAVIARPGNAAVLVSIQVEMDDRGGTFQILFPYATLEPIRELLLQTFMGEKFGRDSIWENHLANQLWHTDFVMQAILERFTASLNDVLNWKKGTRIELQATQDSEIELSCGERSLFKGKMGHSGNHMAIKIDDVLFKKGELNG